MAISTAARKAKGRRFQQQVRDILRKIGLKHGLVAEDFTSTGMGQSGVDVVLSPAAMSLFPCYIECKNVENLNVRGIFTEHYSKYEDREGLKILCHTRNRGVPLATVRLEDLFTLIEENLELKRANAANQERQREISPNL